MVKIGSRLLCLESLIKYFIIHYFQSYQAAVSSSSLRGSGLKPHVYGFRIRLGSFFLLFEGNLGIKCLKFCSWNGDTFQKLWYSNIWEMTNR